MLRYQGKIILALILLWGVGLRLYFIFAPIDSLVTLPPDDALYYFKVAQNLVSGLGSTFDGINLTNGYHPLWLVLLLPFAWLVPSSEWMLRVGLVLSVAFSAGSAVVLYRLLNRLTQRVDLSLLAVVIYFFNPRIIVSSLNGLETSLTTFLFAMLVYFSYFGFSDSLRWEIRSSLCGILLGLLFLTRTDTIFYIFIFTLVFIMQCKSNQRLRSVITTGMVACVVVSPWIGWNLSHFGSFIQTSGQAIPYLLHEKFLAEGHASSEMLAKSARFFVDFLTDDLSSYVGFPGNLFLPILFVLLFTLIRTWLTLEGGLNRFFKIWLGLAGAGLVLIFVHTFIRWYPRQWYFDQIIFLSAGAFSVMPVLPGRIWSHQWLRNALPIGILLLGFASSYVSIQYLQRGVYPHQVEMLDAAMLVKENTTPNEILAGFNVGIISFFSDRQVVNLDGVINNSAFDALKERSLANFLVQNGVSYYLDYDPIMREETYGYWGNAGFELQLVAEIDRPGVSWRNSVIRVYGLEY